MKKKTRYICQECGSVAVKWLGRCPDCGNWNTFVEELIPERRTETSSFGGESPRPLSEVASAEQDRFVTGMAELDRVLGGGIVPGSVLLLGGAPGIGKSTLLLQAAGRLSRKHGYVLYVSGEESLQQTRLRADRLGVDSPALLVGAEIRLESILEHLKNLRPLLLIVDSIQTVHRSDIPSAPGSVAQVRECAAQLMRTAKQENIAVLLVGHVTKDGSIAGPRVLEHIVDTVLSFEGETYHNYRVLRSVKNRFGGTNEVGIFEMSGTGLREVKNPSELFLAQRDEAASGSAIVPVLEGSRPLLVEIQALVSRSAYGMPIRRSTGLDVNRLALLLAVLERRGGLPLGACDVFVNVVGGIRIEETASDLGTVLAIAGSLKDLPLSPSDVFLGEVGLGGEVRTVTQAELRVSEAARLGFKRCILSCHNLPGLTAPPGLKLLGVSTVGEAMDLCGLKKTRNKNEAADDADSAADGIQGQILPFDV